MHVPSLPSREILTLSHCLAAMEVSQAIRTMAVRRMLDGLAPDPRHVGRLEEILAALTPPAGPQAPLRLVLPDGRPIEVDLTQERRELEKDVIFLAQGETALIDHLARHIEGLEALVEAGLDFLDNRCFNCFFTDRDGTLQSYHGRYATSVQSAFSSYFLCRFAWARARRPVMLTSAPLRGLGILDVSTIPSGIFAYGASKGREYVDPAGNRGALPLSPDQRALLAELNRRMHGLVHTAGNEVFGLIGSGLQCKFGQTTIARQDMDGTVPEARSLEFAAEVAGIVAELDPRGEWFRIEDTGLDLEIILTVEDGEGGLKDFDKGDAVTYLDRAMGLGVEHGPHLVCGDTPSDIPMVLAAGAKGAETLAIFVGRAPAGIGSIQDALPDALFLPHPDALVALLGRAADGGPCRC